MHVHVSVLTRRYELSLVKADTTAQHEKRECGGVIDTIETGETGLHMATCEGGGGRMTPPTWGGEPSTRRRRMLLFRRLKPRATRRKSLTPHILHRSTPHRGISTCRQVKGRCASKRGSRWTTPSQCHHLRTLAPITLLTCPFASQRLAIAPIALVSNYVNPTSLTLLRCFRGWRGAWVTATNVGLRESENPTLTHLHLHV